MSIQLHFETDHEAAVAISTLVTSVHLYGVRSRKAANRRNNGLTAFFSPVGPHEAFSLSLENAR